ncbi:hypothetical protein L1049_015846 [Liquidambar formosana]|uniref:Uncharacterized protein n=1 Tax=Liquidambar formosana TaxID=63359 RepID=A0AAP0X6U7_LIQFO
MADQLVEISSTPATPRPASVAPTPPISAPPSQFHSPSLSRSPLLNAGENTENGIVKVKTPRRTPRHLTPLSLTPRFLTPLGSPIRRALHLTKLDPQDAWLPITESRNGNAYYAAFHCLCSGIGFKPLSFLLPSLFLDGEKRGKWLALFPIMYLSGGTCVALIVIGGSTLKAFYSTVCGATCSQPLTTVEWYLVFTCAAVVLSQLP